MLIVAQRDCSWLVASAAHHRLLIAPSLTCCSIRYPFMKRLLAKCDVRLVSVIPRFAFVEYCQCVESNRSVMVAVIRWALSTCLFAVAAKALKPQILIRMLCSGSQTS